MTQPSCVTCRFFHPPSGGVRDAMSQTGECRRNAPTTAQGRWPKTQATDWCGEYQAAGGPPVGCGLPIVRRS